MVNIYTAAFENISCIEEMLLDDFSNPAKESAAICFEKGAKIYKLYGTNIAIMTHSDQFSKTKNQISWYEVWKTNEDDGRINYINVMSDSEQVIEKVPKEMYEEIIFFADACKGSNG